MKRANRLVYSISGVLIVVFVTYYTINYKSPKTSNNYQTETSSQQRSSDVVLREFLISDTWWNDEFQLAIDFYEDGTGLYVEGLNIREPISYQFGKSSSLIIENERSKVMINAKVNSVNADSLSLDTSRWGTITLVH
ncbi:hypothetical protein [Owenweeksia hongkongensis]|uniref:hypothetical protein n=1 Tax=Owenweeksia hongkongensis TaxID=253245 RepID=UPI003A91941A